MLRHARFPGLICLLVALSGCHITGERRHAEGFVDLDGMHLVPGRRDVSISLGSLPLRFAGFFVDDEVGDLLSDLDAVRIHIYELDASKASNGLASAAQKLQNHGWESLVAIRGRDADSAEVMVRLGRRNRVAGLVVMTQDADEMVVINLIGDIRPERFADYLRGLDVDGPDIEIEAG